MRHFINFAKVLLLFLFFLFLMYCLLSFRKIPREIAYGVSFSKLHADELALPWKEVYTALLDDLRVRNLRLSAHWPMIEPKKDIYDFSSLDYQVSEAQKSGVEVILAVGRRLPGWPECHAPAWASDLSWEEKKEELRAYIETTIMRYKGYANIKYWQVENEPFLEVFAKDHCGDLDKGFLAEEIALVRDLDSSRKILVTDSGNLGLWGGAWRAGDVFGTSVYLYLWNPTIGQVRTVYRPSVYRVKTSISELLFGEKESMLIELSLEPWLLEPAISAQLDVQLQRMSIDKFNEVIKFAKRTGFEKQYLWGAEWWYWMKQKGHDEYWEEAKVLFDD